MKSKNYKVEKSINQTIKKLLLVTLISISAAIIFPNETKAFYSIDYAGCFYLINGTKCCGYLIGGVGYFPPTIVNYNGYCGTDRCSGIAILIGIGIIIPLDKTTTKNDNIQDFLFDVLPGENLQVKTNVNVECDIYELTSGQLILKNINITGNNIYQITSIIPSNIPYLIQFKVNGNIVSQQSFIFNNINSLSTGGDNE